MNISVPIIKNVASRDENLPVFGNCMGEIMSMDSVINMSKMVYPSNFSIIISTRVTPADGTGRPMNLSFCLRTGKADKRIMVAVR